MHVKDGEQPVHADGRLYVVDGEKIKEQIADLRELL